jgi:NAD(P)-dependent dehydrogenase (short-subunit alcohol dehydrogenase family)
MDQQKTFLVVGASGTLGKAVAHVITEAGFGLVAAARDVDRLQGAVSSAAGPAIRCYRLDLCDAKSIAKFAEQISADVPRLTGVINCAAGFYKGAFASMTDEKMSDLLWSNFGGMVLLINKLLPVLQRSAPSDVINITSISSATTLDTSKSSSLHIATKAALQVFDTVVGRELSTSGVRVTTIAPSTLAKEGRLGISVPDLAQFIVQLLRLPSSIRVETIAVYPNGPVS